MLWLILLILWPIAELIVAIKVAEAIGVLAMLLLLVLSWPLGIWALRSEGRAALRRLSDAVAARRAPGREVLDGALVLIGGLLLIVPGFITDALGLVLLLPPTRALARGGLARTLLRTPMLRFVSFGAAGFEATGFGAARRDYDADSTAIDIDQPQLRG